MATSGALSREAGHEDDFPDDASQAPSKFGDLGEAEDWAIQALGRRKLANNYPFKPEHKPKPKAIQQAGREELMRIYRVCCPDGEEGKVLPECVRFANLPDVIRLMASQAVSPSGMADEEVLDEPEKVEPFVDKVLKYAVIMRPVGRRVSFQVFKKGGERDCSPEKVCLAPDRSGAGVLLGHRGDTVAIDLSKVDLEDPESLGKVKATIVEYIYKQMRGSGGSYLFARLAVDNFRRIV